MRSSEDIDHEIIRLKVLLIIFFVAMLFLAGVLSKEQVVRGESYRTSSEKQSIRRVRIPGERGRIYDRNKVCLADTRPDYCIALFVEELRAPGRWKNTVLKVEEVLDKASRATGLPVQLTSDDIMLHIRRRLPLPLIAWRGLKSRDIARFEEQDGWLGADIYYEPVRVYPEGKLASHLLGYVGRADFSEKDEPFHYYLSEMEGKEGIEQVFNSMLAGQAGGRLLTVDASGFKRNEVKERTGRGQDVVLTIDTEIQRAVEDVLSDVKGAAVVIDPRNGDVLAMASRPSFDPNLFAPAITSREWKRLITDPAKPLVNRAISGTYPPGSIFKPVIALAALQTGAATPNTTYNCPGHYYLGKLRFGCWLKTGHGPISMRKAIEQSCNVYFYNLGRACNYDDIYNLAHDMGFGKTHGVEVRGEAAGLLPNEKWKRRVLKEGWREGDTCNISIGQGALLVTPLQMAMFTSAVANDGYMFRPRLVIGDSSRGDFIAKLSIKDSGFQLIREGMHDVVHAERGTGKRARVDGIEIGGKTGTAQYGPRGSGKVHTWMIAFVPYQYPRYALALVVEDGVSGGITCAPRVKTIVESLMALEKKRDAVKTGG